MDAIDENLVHVLRDEYHARTSEMWQQNTDFGQRLREASVTAVYDGTDDRFELRLDGSQEALSYSIHNTLYVLTDFETRKIVGLELEQFTSHVVEQSTEFRFFWNALLQSRVKEIVLRPANQADRSVSLDNLMKELVAAG